MVTKPVDRPVGGGVRRDHEEEVNLDPPFLRRPRGKPRSICFKTRLPTSNGKGRRPTPRVAASVQRVQTNIDSAEESHRLGKKEILILGRHIEILGHLLPEGFPKSKCPCKKKAKGGLEREVPKVCTRVKSFVCLLCKKY